MWPGPGRRGRHRARPGLGRPSSRLPTAGGGGLSLRAKTSQAGRSDNKTPEEQKQTNQGWSSLGGAIGGVGGGL